MPLYTCPTTKLALDADAELGMAFILTPCCGATGKGNADVETGVVCRSCYREVSPIFGMAYGKDAMDHAAFMADWRALMDTHGCPAVGSCAATANHHREQALEG